MGLLVLGASSEAHLELAATRRTGAPAGDSTPCRGSARARGILRGSPRACCDPTHGSSCGRLHTLPWVCSCSGHPPRLTPSLLRPDARELLRETPHPAVAMPWVCSCSGQPPRLTPSLLRPEPRELMRETPHPAVALPWVCSCSGQPPRLTPSLLRPDARELLRETPHPAVGLLVLGATSEAHPELAATRTGATGDSTPCRGSARARGILRAPRACCDPTHGSSCGRLHTAVGLLVLGASSEAHPELAATRRTGANAGDSTPCRGSARARGILRGSPRACCDPTHGSSCGRLHTLPWVCSCSGQPPRLFPSLLRPEPRELMRETPHPAVAMPWVCSCSGQPPRLTPSLLRPELRELMRETPHPAVGLLVLGASSEAHPELAANRRTGANAGDSTPCRGSARARGNLRGSSRACCDPNHGS